MNGLRVSICLQNLAHVREIVDNQHSEHAVHTHLSSLDIHEGAADLAQFKHIRKPQQRFRHSNKKIYWRCHMLAK